MADTSVTFTAVDLSRLPAPNVIEPLRFEQIYGEMLASLQALLPSFDATVESDPAVMLLRVCAYRELLLRGRINDAAKAVMPAFATGTDLDHLAALMSVTRLELDPGDPANNVPPTYESDTALRARLVLAPEGFSVAGPEGAYIFHARSADGDVLDASATSPAPGQVLVTILSRLGNGTPAPDLLAKVAAHVSAETVRPLTDAVMVQSATILPYQITASLTTFSGPDGSIVLAEAQRRVQEYRERQHRLGVDITRSGIFAALHVEGVQNVVLSAPAADIIVDRTQAAYCTGIALTYAGTGE
ncbi:baseplate J/gp47 family protein [Sphingomonas sp. R1]|uniref:baseplate assembly protein n=1 Tax=Sphingomonas sp. R1 TaxID=399176 RepID=UPI0022251862|nr:baseplate J/gp47 family protein [Sphingomonas sp. R1]UYY78408.1 baseplate J/gp47 family protein [Sphingomonas sp. R1]